MAEEYFFVYLEHNYQRRLSIQSWLRDILALVTLDIS